MERKIKDTGEGKKGRKRKRNRAQERRKRHKGRQKTTERKYNF
jgi:hypothetical protein